MLWAQRQPGNPSGQSYTAAEPIAAKDAGQEAAHAATNGGRRPPRAAAVRAAADRQHWLHEIAAQEPSAGASQPEKKLDECSSGDQGSSERKDVQHGGKSKRAAAANGRSNDAAGRRGAQRRRADKTAADNDGHGGDAPDDVGARQDLQLEFMEDRAWYSKAAFAGPSGLATQAARAVAQQVGKGEVQPGQLLESLHDLDPDIVQSIGLTKARVAPLAEEINTVHHGSLQVTLIPGQALHAASSQPLFMFSQLSELQLSQLTLQ